MSDALYTPKDTLYRRIVNLLKSNYTLLVFLKVLNPGRRIEIVNIKRGLLSSGEGDGSLLDVGCGDGYWSRYFSKYVSKVVGIEPYEVDLMKAQKYAIPKTEFLFGTAEKMSFNDNSFDRIVSVCVFEHLYDDVAAFREFYRVLADNGVMLATVDSLSSPYISQKHIQWHMSACYCKQLYTVESITKKLKTAGFAKIEAFYIMGSRISVFWEILMEKIGVFAFVFLPIFWPLIMILERGEKKSGYKIFVKASK